MISAREESERIISKATRTAAEIRTQLAAELARVGEEAEKLGGQYLNIKQDAVDCTERLHAVLEAMCVELEGVQGRLAQLRSLVEPDK
jgi:vacuolar-type H+-ATPase subunit H